MVAMILPFSATDLAWAEYTNPKDKTLERTQEKQERALILQAIQELHREQKELKDKLHSENDQSEKQRINARLNAIESELDRIERNNHRKDMPQSKITETVGQKDAFEAKLLRSNAAKFVTTIGIDVTSQEIQVGLNKNLVNPSNVDSILYDLQKMMPADANWHFVFSDTAQLLSCDQEECDPIIGGNLVKVSGTNKNCSFGFQAKKGSTWGWVTAGHCVDGKINYKMLNSSNRHIGTVKFENFRWGTYCDCAWITSSSSVVDNKVFTAGIHTIKKTTPVSGQQNDTIMKTGQAGGVDIGTISALHVTVLDLYAGEYMRDLVRSNVLMDHGDSGGTIVEFRDNSDLYGIMITHDWWGQYHAPIDRITSTLGITPVLN